MGRGKNRTVVWVVDEPGVRALLARLEERICTLPGLSEFKFVDPMPELGMAKTLLDKCGGNQELALLVIEQYFKGSQHIWVKPKSFAQILWNRPSRSGQIGLFSLALAYAKEEYHESNIFIEAGKLPDLE
jgi:hypothetical protein